jgi:O-antigen/teichoic acid export membrane protein
MREALPIWLSGLFLMLYFKADTVLLRVLAGEAELGAYSAAYKVFEGSMLLPAIVVAVAFPLLARAHQDRQRQRRWEISTALLLLGLGLPVGLVLHAARTGIVAALFGPAFVPAIPSLGVLAWGVPITYLNCGLTHFLIARDLGRATLVLAASMLVVNVAINLVAIPRWGGPGAAWATVFTEATLAICCLLTLAARSAPKEAQSAPAATSTDHKEG